MIRCSNCGDWGARLMRGQKVIIPLCDACSTAMPVADIFGRELRIMAVAVEAFTEASGYDLDDE